MACGREAPEVARLQVWNAARDAAGLPESFTPYNARHTGISWAIDKGVDLQKVRERDTSVADALEAIFDGSRHAGSLHENTTEFDAARLLTNSTD